MPTITQAQLSRIATQQERMMLSSFNAILSEIRDGAILSEIVRQLEIGRVDQVIELLGLNEAAWSPMEQSLREAYRTGGVTGSAQVGRIPTSAGTLVARFNIRAPDAERWLATQSSRLITEVSGNQVEIARRVMTDGLAAGRNPRSVALDIVGRIDPTSRKRVGGFIGLTDNQAGWIVNARSELESLNPNYLTRQLRDRRFDKAIEQAIADGKPLSGQQIDAAITQMQNRAQRYRGQVIARTESINALRAGQHESVLQAIDAGELDMRDVTKAWDSTGDGVTRETHQIAEIENTNVPFDEPFIVGGYEMMYPGDSSLGAPAEEIIQCRCRERTVINFAGQLRRIEGFS